MVKKYREDLQLWETKMKFLFITFYKYSIWNKGKTKSFYRLFKKKGAKYTECYPTEITITQEELKKKYGSIWVTPINFKIV